YRFDKVDLIQLVEDTLTLMDHRMTAEKTGIKIERRFSGTPALVLADGDKLKQVFWNICENAVRAMKNGGTLTAAVEAVGEEWQIAFTDTGTGMTPQQIEKIFEPFQSNFEGGTRLCKRTKARCGHVQSLDREQRWYCDCIAWTPLRLARKNNPATP